MIKPTPRSVRLIVAGLLVSLLLIALHVDLWTLALAFLAASVAAIVTDHAIATRPRDLQIDAGPPNKLEVGVAKVLDITIDVDKPGRPLWLDLTIDAGDLIRAIPWTRLNMPAEAKAEAKLDLVAHRRGVTDAVVLWLRWQGPLGLCWRSHEAELADAMTILPDASAVRHLGIQLRGRRLDPGRRLLNLRGPGTEFDSLREHQEGMDSRSIDWKHSARHQKLLSKEYQPESNHRIILAVDCGYLMREPLAGIPRLDHAIRATLAMIYAALASGDRVGLFSLGATPGAFIEPVAGLARFPHLRHAAAELDYRSEETNFTFGLAHLGLQLKNRSLVVFITDFVNATSAELMVESLGRMARRHLVLFVALADPGLKTTAERAPNSIDDIAKSIVASDLLRNRQLVIERLKRRGVQCLDALPHDLAPSLIERYLSIKQLELI